MYSAEKQNDGTYIIYYSKYGLNKEIVKPGVRGCNVVRVVEKMQVDDMNKEFKEEREKKGLKR